MTDNTPHSPDALAYANALLDLAEERGAVEAVANDAGALREAFADTPEVRRFLTDPVIADDERQKVLAAALADAHDLLRNVTGLMSVRGRLSLLPEVLDAFETVLDERLGKVEVDVTVAQRLDDKQLARVKERVGRTLGRDPVVHQYVDPEIIGGLILKVGDKVVDASVRRQLAAMRERLLK